MAYTRKAKGAIVRRLGANVFDNPKYDRLLKRKPHGPGQAKGARRRSKESEFALQLKEKQKLRFAYGMNERQFHNTFRKAKQQGGQTGTNLLVLLERRLDNTVYRLGLAATRSQARQLVSHGHISVNGSRVNIPSYLIREGDSVSVRAGSAVQKMVREKIASARKPVPAWLALDTDALRGTVQRYPFRDDIPIAVNDQMVVEYYSR